MPLMSRHAFIAGCTASAGSVVHLAIAETPRDTLVIAQNLDGMITCDPAEAYENSTYQILAQVYDKIMLYDPDSPSMIGNGARAREHELVLTSWGPDFLDPEASAEPFAWNPDNSDNAAYKPLPWRSAGDIPELTQRVNALTLENDAACREQRFIAIEKQLQESSPFIFLFQLIDTWATRSTVSGITERLLGDQIFYFRTTK